MALEEHCSEQDVIALGLEEELHVQSAQEQIELWRGKRRAQCQVKAGFYGTLKSEVGQKDKLIKEKDDEIRRLKETIAALEQRRPVMLPCVE